MRALFIEHDDLSMPGLLAQVIANRGFDIAEFCVAPPTGIPERDVVFPSLSGVDLVVAMGAPWSVYDPAIANWVRAELDLLTRADACGIPVLGVCFGGQLLAQAHGGTVTAAPEREIGWMNVEVDDQALIEPGPWFQWHSDRWSVPPGADELARTAVASQAFVLRRNLAVQFHPELTPDILGSWMARAGAPIGYDRSELIQLAVEHQPAAARRADRLVANFLDMLASGDAGEVRAC